jgi:hypothetical protein
LPTTFRLDPFKWSPELAKMKEHTKETRSLNSYIDMMRSIVISTEMDLIHKDEDTSLLNVQAVIRGVYKNHKTLIDMFQNHNERIGTEIFRPS